VCMYIHFTKCAYCKCYDLEAKSAVDSSSDDSADSNSDEDLDSDSEYSDEEDYCFMVSSELMIMFYFNVTHLVSCCEKFSSFFYLDLQKR